MPFLIKIYKKNLNFFFNSKIFHWSLQKPGSGSGFIKSPNPILINGPATLVTLQYFCWEGCMLSPIQMYTHLRTVNVQSQIRVRIKPLWFAFKIKTRVENNMSKRSFFYSIAATCPSWPAIGPGPLFMSPFGCGICQCAPQVPKSFILVKLVLVCFWAQIMPHTNNCFKLELFFGNHN